MGAASVYSLPFIVGNRYVLSAVLSETADTVMYAANQKDMRREVVVESLRPEAMQNPLLVQEFLDAARAQTRMGGGAIASTLELIYAEDTWHLARERVEGIPLDEMVKAGDKLPASALCELMLLLCRTCIKMDIEDIEGARFMLQHLFYSNSGFRLRNPALGGRRSRNTSRRVLTSAAADLQPLVDECSPHAAALCSILRRMQYPSDWISLSPLFYDEELVRLQQKFAE